MNITQKGNIMKENFKAGFIGCGNMGGALAGVAAKALGGERVLVTDHNLVKMAALSEKNGCITSDAANIAGSCDFVVVGVKPQVLPDALREIKEKLLARENGSFALITMAAGIKISAIEEQLGQVPVIRIMPNTPCACGEGVILYCSNNLVTEDMLEAFRRMFAPAGLLISIAEAKIDAGSAVSGCGPAFVYMFIDALIDGGVRAGLPRAVAKNLAQQTVLGSAKYALDTGEEPAKLKADVCSPAGSTIEGVAVLEEYSFRSAVMEAVKAAFDRTAELGK